jgi:hypothetical protein
MEKFFEQLFENEDYIDDQEEHIELFKSSFAECEKLSDYNIQDLKFLCIEDDGENALFTFENQDIIVRYFFFDPVWYVPERHELITGHESTLEGVELLENSSENIEYVLYPFEQGGELPLEYLIIEPGVFIDKSTLKEIYSNGTKLNHRIKWTNDLTLVLNNDGPYKVKSGKKVISGFIDEPTHFQIGDCMTIAYIDGSNNLIVCQHGDVSSVVIIKNKSQC